MLNALRRRGQAKDAMGRHGFCSSASTLLNELGYNRDRIEGQLAHGERNDVRAAYNYAEYWPERGELFARYKAGIEARKNKLAGVKEREDT